MDLPVNAIDAYDLDRETFRDIVRRTPDGKTRIDGIIDIYLPMIGDQRWIIHRHPHIAGL